ncbi:MAG TPA: molybdate ABC transporter substrate-binding protein [Myxococcota bacterium]|nr:molybdate ABC transporter substrate-binding protein [Myxococcota bacterium]
MWWACRKNKLANRATVSPRGFTAWSSVQLIAWIPRLNRGTTRKSVIAVVILLISCSEKGERDPIKLYLASSLTPLAEDIKALFAKEEKIDLIFLSSSAVAKQVLQGAPCDGIILADDEWNKKLLNHGKVLGGVKQFAKNTLVLARMNPIPALLDAKTHLQRIDKGEKIVISDPDYVPLGRYTQEALEHLGLDKKLSGQLIKAHSARQASLLLKRGLGTWAILYRTDAIHDGAVVVARIDPSLHRSMDYLFLACKGAASHRVAKLDRLLFSEGMKRALVKRGFR